MIRPSPLRIAERRLRRIVPPCSSRTSDPERRFNAKSCRGCEPEGAGDASCVASRRAAEVVCPSASRSVGSLVGSPAPITARIRPRGVAARRPEQRQVASGGEHAAAHARHHADRWRNGPPTSDVDVVVQFASAAQDSVPAERSARRAARPGGHPNFPCPTSWRRPCAISSALGQLTLLPLEGRDREPAPRISGHTASTTAQQPSRCRSGPVPVCLCRAIVTAQGVPVVFVASAGLLEMRRPSL
jgi:hypothetical protein